MTDNRVVVLQGSDIKKLQEDLAQVVKANEIKPHQLLNLSQPFRLLVPGWGGRILSESPWSTLNDFSVQ